MERGLWKVEDLTLSGEGEDWLRRQLYPIAVGCGSRFGDAQRQAARNLMLACPRKSFKVNLEPRAPIHPM